MTRIKNEQLDSRIDVQFSTLGEDNKQRLYSYSRIVEDGYIDPVEFFNRAKATNKNRMFWGSPDDEFYIVGVGSVYEISAHGNRFENTKKQWQQLLDEAAIIDPYRVPGTGITALGGMSFDPRRKRTPLWEHFGDSQFIVPEVTLTVYEGECYITTNFLRVEENKTKPSFDEIEETKTILLKNDYEHDPQQTIVINKTEKAIDEWLLSVQKAIDEIKSGQANKIVLARELRLKLNQTAHIGNLLSRLLDTQANSYIFAFERGDDCFIGATPERLVRVEGQELLSTCLAGTAPRGKTPQEDEEIRTALLQDDKNLEEHDHVVQMIRQGITPYCTNIDIPSAPTVRCLKDLQHLYTPVRATLKQEHSIFDIVEQLHPTPALGGVPYEKSLAFIRDHESFDRGWYGAPVGWLDSNKNGDFAVAIRSGLIQDDEASLFAGCGIMKDSNVNKEYEETSIKFLPMLNVLGD